MKPGSFKNLTMFLGRRILPFLFTLLVSDFCPGQSPYQKLDDWMDEHAKDLGGRAILVIYKDSQVIYSKSVNEMTRQQKSINRYVQKRMGNDPNHDDYSMDSRQPIASCSKWLSAALVMTFVDEGKLRLSDTVGTWLPVLSAHGKGNITISECLSHLTGIKEPPLRESLKKMKDIVTMDRAIEVIAEMPMEGEHGKVFHYSSAGLQIAAAVIEKISSQSFEELFAQRISAPLGLKNTDFGKKVPAFPAGGASSTPEDYINFLRMILQKGNYNGKQVLSEKAVMEMELNRVGPGVRVAYTPAEAGDFGYGFGEWVPSSGTIGDPAEWVTSPGLFGSFPWVENKRNYCAFLMTFYLKSKDRNSRYLSLKKLVDETISRD